MKNYSVQSILDWLETKNYLNERRTAEAFVLTHANVNRLPFYIHILMGFGAIIGCVCVIGLLFSMEIISLSDPKTLFICGFLSIAASMACYYLLRYQTPFLQSFGLQCALIFMVVGKVLVVIGFDQLDNSNIVPYNEWFITLGLFIVTAPTYFLFSNQIDRFLSSLALLLSILYNTIFLYQTNLYFSLYYVALIILTGFFFIWRRKSLSWTPLGYAVVLTLCASALYLLVLFEPKIALLQEAPLNVPALFFNAALGLALILLCLILGKERKSFIQPSTAIACMGICLLTFVTTPGILLSLGLLIIGYAKHEMALNIIGACFLCICLIAFYYSLPFTFDYKAAMLVSTGVILLAARFVLKLMHWDNEPS